MTSKHFNVKTCPLQLWPYPTPWDIDLNKRKDFSTYNSFKKINTSLWPQPTLGES